MTNTNQTIVKTIRELNARLSEIESDLKRVKIDVGLEIDKNASQAVIDTAKAEENAATIIKTINILKTKTIEEIQNVKASLEQVNTSQNRDISALLGRVDKCIAEYGEINEFCKECLIKLNNHSDKLKLELSKHNDDLKANTLLELSKHNDELKTELSKHNDELKTELSKHNDELKTELSKHNDELKTELSKHNDELKTELSKHNDNLKAELSKHNDNLKAELDKHILGHIETTTKNLDEYKETLCEAVSLDLEAKVEDKLIEIDNKCNDKLSTTIKTIDESCKQTSTNIIKEINDELDKFNEAKRLFDEELNKTKDKVTSDTNELVKSKLTILDNYANGRADILKEQTQEITNNLSKQLDNKCQDITKQINDQLISECNKASDEISQRLENKGAEVAEIIASQISDKVSAEATSVVNRRLDDKVMAGVSMLDNKTRQSLELIEENSSAHVKVLDDKAAEHIQNIDSKANEKLELCTHDADNKLSEFLSNANNDLKKCINDTFEVKLKEFDERINQVVKSAETTCQERSSFKFDDLKNIFLQMFTEWKDDAVKQVQQAVENKVADVQKAVEKTFNNKVEEIEASIKQKVKDQVRHTSKQLEEKLKPRGLPDCEIKSVTYVEDDGDNAVIQHKALKIGPDVEILELDNGQIVIDKNNGLLCRGYGLQNTLDDSDIIAVIDPESKFQGNDLVGRYVEFDNIDDDNFVHVSIHNAGLSNKVFAIVRRVLPSQATSCVYKHKIIDLDPSLNYCVIAIQGFVNVRVKPGSYKIGEIIVPNGDGLYTNDIKYDRFWFTLNNCVPKIKVLAAIDDEMVSGLIC